MIPKPRVSLHGSGESIELDNRAGEFVLMQGTTGLGWGPQEITSAPLPQGGAVRRHQRTAEADVVIPFLLGGDYDQRFAARRQLERLCDDLVEVRVTQPSGETRSRFGYYQDGLGGEYGPGEDSVDGQKIALTIACLDSDWYGAEQVLERKVKPADKPFITGLGYQDVRRNLIFNPGVEYGRQGFSPFSGNAQTISVTNDAKSGQSALLVTAQVGSGTPNVKTPNTPVARNAFYTLGFQVKASALVSAIRVSFWERDNSFVTPSGSTKVFPVETYWTRVAFTSAVVTRKDLTAQVELLTSQDGSLVAAPAGEWAAFDEFILEAGPEVGPYFDGDSLSTAGVQYAWEGAPGQSASVRTTGKTSAVLPFFPVILAASTVQGDYVIINEGDKEAWPTYTVTGPGKDLEVVNRDTGERIFVQGDFTEQVTITTRPQNQDISSELSADGALWDRVSLDSRLFPLRPGRNRIALSMVNGSPESKVTISFREVFKSGH